MKRRIFIILLAIAVPAAAAWQFFSGKSETLRASGTIEARNIHVGSKEGGRVVKVLAHEGDLLKAGQLILVFDDAELEGRVEEARGNLALARANLEKMENGSRPEDIAEARAAAGTGETDRGFRAAQFEQTQADLARARVELVNARRTFERAKDLRQKDLGSQQALDDAQAAYDAAQQQVKALEHAVAAAQGQYKAAQAATQRVENGYRKEDIDAARAQVMQAEGILKQAEARLAEHEVRAPADAVVEVLDLRPGDLVSPGATVAKLLETGQLYVMVYVPETRISQVHLGETADLRVDSLPDKAFRAKVEQIRQQAEFLPRNVQTIDERVHQVVGVKLHVDDPDRLLRIGTNADVTFTPGESP